jgi:azurin
MTNTTILGVALAVLFACGACDNKGSAGGGAPKPATTTEPAATSAAPTSAAPASAAPAQAAETKKVEIQIASVGNEMRFDKTALTVPAGAEVHIVLKNNSNMETMPHNWVLVKPGTEAQVALDGLNKAPDAGYVVAGPDIYAYTPLAPPGKTVELTFTAPAAGKYPYICTVPGHYVLMKGVLTVTP